MKSRKRKQIIDNLECLIFGLNFRSSEEKAIYHELLAAVLGTLIYDLRIAKKENSK